MSKTRLMTSAAVVVAGLALSSCGSAMPGVAAQVGDIKITNRTADETTLNMCTALGDQLEADGRTLPMSFVRQGVMQLMVLRAEATAIAEEYDVKTGATYQRGRAQQESLAESMPQDARETYIDLTSTNAYANDILDQVGRIELEEQGVSDPTVEEATQAGIEVFTQWPEANGIEIDPRYGLETQDGVLTPVDTNVSVAVSDQAKAGLELEPNAAYTDTLPLNQRCG